MLTMNGGKDFLDTMKYTRRVRAKPVCAKQMDENFALTNHGSTRLGLRGDYVVQENGVAFIVPAIVFGMCYRPAAPRARVRGSAK